MASAGSCARRSGVPASSRSPAPTADPQHCRGLPVLLLLEPDLKRPCSPFHILATNKLSKVSALVHLLHLATIQATLLLSYIHVCVCVSVSVSVVCPSTLTTSSHYPGYFTRSRLLYYTSLDQLHLLHQATIETPFEKVHTVPLVPIPGASQVFLCEIKKKRKTKCKKNSAHRASGPNSRRPRCLPRRVQ